MGALHRMVQGAQYFRDTPMFSCDQSVLLVVDVQGKLASLMFEKEKILENIRLLIKAAKILGIPILWTEQAPDKIGKTVPEIAKHMRGYSPIVKSSFSCCGEKIFLDALKKLKRHQIIVAGIETHVCVYQTVADLVKRKYQVQVVADAVSSRTQENKLYGLERIKQEGGLITCLEMVCCELLKKAGGEKFKGILQLIK